MDNLHKITNILDAMKSNKVSNYVIAGLNSYLINQGNVRLFENERDHQDSITPHSHRFNFVCMVLNGSVTNRVWNESTELRGDFFQVSTLQYEGQIGKHSVKAEGRNWWSYEDTTYSVGDIYSMSHNEIHSIIFSRGAKVLFFEGPQITDKSLILEPVVDSEVIPTYVNKSYMFKKEE